MIVCLYVCSNTLQSFFVFRVPRFSPSLHPFSPVSHRGSAKNRQVKEIALRITGADEGEIEADTPLMEAGLTSNSVFWPRKGGLGWCLSGWVRPAVVGVLRGNEPTCGWTMT